MKHILLKLFSTFLLSATLLLTACASTSETEPAQQTKTETVKKGVFKAGSTFFIHLEALGGILNPF